MGGNQPLIKKTKSETENGVGSRVKSPKESRQKDVIAE
jgi:hypothetical protein